MKLDIRRFAIAVATVWAIAGLVCAFAFKTAPAAYTGAANFLLHADMYRVTRAVGWGELGLGGDNVVGPRGLSRRRLSRALQRSPRLETEVFVGCRAWR